MDIAGVKDVPPDKEVESILWIGESSTVSGYKIIGKFTAVP